MLDELRKVDLIESCNDTLQSANFYTRRIKPKTLTRDYGKIKKCVSLEAFEFSDNPFRPCIFNTLNIFRMKTMCSLRIYINIYIYIYINNRF